MSGESGPRRRANLGLVLGHLRAHGPRSRTELAVETGLTKATVTALVAELVSAEAIIEHEVTHTGQSGRPSRPLALWGPRVHGLGIDLGTDRAVGVVTNLAGEVLERLDVASSSVAEAAAELAGGLVGFSTGAGGLVAGVTIARSSELAAVGPSLDADIEAMVSGRLSAVVPTAPLAFERTANACAMAERRLRAPDSDALADADLVVVLGDPAVAAGVVIDGELRRGASGRAGEVGHLLVRPDGDRCRCGARGCWETLVGVEAILREAAPDLAANPRFVRSGDVLSTVAARARAGDADTLVGLKRVAWWLATGLSSIIAVFDPDLIVLQGYFAELSPWLLDDTQAALSAFSSGSSGRRQRVELVVSTIEGAVAARGAAALALDPVVADPAPTLSRLGSQA